MSVNVTRLYKNGGNIGLTLWYLLAKKINFPDFLQVVQTFYFYRHI